MLEIGRELLELRLELLLLDFFDLLSKSCILESLSAKAVIRETKVLICGLIDGLSSLFDSDFFN